MSHISGFGDVTDTLSANELYELGEIMERASRLGGYGAIPEGEQKVRERLLEMRSEREQSSPRRRYSD
jgi:hypothetical protein